MDPPTARPVAFAEHLAADLAGILRGEGVLSKAEAADWARSDLPAAHRATITKAASAYRHGREEPCPPQEVRTFIRWAAAQASQAEAWRPCVNLPGRDGGSGPTA